MSGLHFISLPLEIRQLRQWAGRRGLGLDEGKVLHHLLTETFGRGALQPFRLMVAPRAARATLYAYTPASVDVLRRTALETGLPDALSICEPDNLAAKTMPGTWNKGRRLGFDLRARPVRRLHRAMGAFRKGAEVDAFLVEALRRFPESPPESDGVDRAAVYREWLASRLAPAAEITEVRVARLDRHTVERGRRKLNGPDVTFHGQLVVTDGAALVECLANGVGRHTAFGYGMLLLRPAG